MGAGSSLDEQVQLKPTLKKQNSLITVTNQQGGNEQINEVFNKIFLKVQRNTIKSIEIDEFDRIYVESGQNLQKFFQAVQQRISDIYISLSRKTLQMMGEKKLSNTESKILISEQVLYTSINILKAIGLKSNFKFNSEIATSLNNLQIFILGYMKAKYPRTNQNFVPGQLMQEIKNFDLVEQPQNDVLRFLNIYFGQTDQKALNYKVKKFLNLILYEMDQKFPKFKQLVAQKIFVVTKEGVQYMVRNKINRKIPENVQKFIEDDSIIDFKQPEIFRVIVKWVQDMQDYLLNAYDEVKQKDHFKTVSPNQNGINFDFVTPDQISTNISDLQNILNEYKVEYEKQLTDLKKCIQLFNHNLIRALAKAQRKQKYVPKKQAQVIKYSMFNKRLLSWLLIEKLMIVLKKLIRTSQKMEQIIGIKLDLVKFNVTNLMRANMVGNKFEIKKVFNNLKNLQNQGQLKILKIHNRLETPLNDVSVIFKMTGSFILCQLQLILSDGNQSETDKLKNIEVLNHFFYEIERSSYGVMAELASLIGSKDNKANFEQKITFQKAKQMDIIYCQKSHGQKVQKVKQQKIPFLCSVCTQLYEEDENQYFYKNCTECNQYLCFRCMIEQGRQSEKQLRKKAIEAKIRKQLNAVAQLEKQIKSASMSSSTSAHEIDTDSKANIQAVHQYLSTGNETPVREISKRKNLISFKQLQKHVKKYYKGTEHDQKLNVLYFSIGQMRRSEISFLLMKYDRLNGIKYSFKYGYEDSIKEISYKYFDFVMIHENLKVNQGANTFNEQTNIKLFKNIKYPDLKQKSSELQVMTLSIDIAQRANTNENVHLTFDFVVYKNIKEEIMKKQFNYESIAAIRDNLPNLLQTHEIYEMSDQGIENQHLIYFSEVNWKKDIKIINLHNNKISDISVLLDNLPSIEKLVISKNFIQKLKFSKKLDNFKKLIATNNKIQQITNLENISSAINITMANNELIKFNQNKIRFERLRILNLSQNFLQTLSTISKREYPKLNNLAMGGAASIMNQEMVILDLPNLINLELTSFYGTHIQVPNSENLQSLYLSELTVDSIKLPETKRLKRCQIQCCYNNQEFQKQFMQTYFSYEFPLLTSLYMRSCWEMTKLPVLKMPLLKSLDFNQVTLNDISSLEISNLESLEQINLSYNNLLSLPVLKLSKLKFVTIYQSNFEDVSNLSKWETPLLQKFEITRIVPEATIPSLNNFPSLTSIVLHGGCFSEDALWQNSHIQYLSLTSTNFQKLSILKLPKLKTFSNYQCFNMDLSILQLSSFQNLSTLKMQNNILKMQKDTFPVIIYPRLESFTLTGCSLNDVSNLGQSTLPKLKKIDLSYNTISRLSALKFEKLQQINLHSNQIDSTEWLQNSQLPSLKTMNLQNNRFQTFPKLNFAKLTNLDISQCQIKNCSNIILSNLPLIHTIQMTGSKNRITTYPQVKLPSVVNFNISTLDLNDISTLQRCAFDKLNKLNLSKVKLIVPALPKLNLPCLIQLFIDDSNIEDITKLAQSNLPKLVTLSFYRTPVKQLPVLNCPSLKNINASGSQALKKEGKGLLSINNLEFSVLPQLDKIILEFNLIKRLPKMNFPKLTSFYLKQNQITDGEDFNNSYLPKLNLFNLYDNKINIIPKGKSVKVPKLYMQGAQATNFEQIHQISNIFQHFYYNSGILPQKVPELEFQKVTILQMSKCMLKSINQLVKHPFPQLLQLVFLNNQIVKVPKLVAPKLQRLFFTGNCINDLGQFSKSFLPSIKLITFDSNEIEDLVDFPFENVQNVYFNNNRLSNLSVLSKYTYKNLTTWASYNNKIKIMPKFNAPMLQNLYIYQNEIQSFDSMKGSNLSGLFLINANNNKMKQLKSLNLIQFPALSTLHFNNNCITKLCKLTTIPFLSQLNVNGNPIENLDEFIQGKYQNLTRLQYSLKVSKSVQADIIKKVDQKLNYMGIFTKYKNPDEDSDSEG